MFGFGVVAGVVCSWLVWLWLERPKKRMLLLTFKEWRGRSARETGDFDEKMTTIATRLPLANALSAVCEYERKYNQRFAPRSTVEFTLLWVEEIPFMDDDDIRIARLEVAECLAKRLQDLK